MSWTVAVEEWEMLTPDLHLLAYRTLSKVRHLNGAALYSTLVSCGSMATYAFGILVDYKLELHKGKRSFATFIMWVSENDAVISAATAVFEY